MSDGSITREAEPTEPSEPAATAAAANVPVEHHLPEPQESPAVRPKKRWYSVFAVVNGWWAVPIILVASIVAGFADPDFGFNEKSIRLVVTFFFVFVILNLGGSGVKWLVAYQRKQESRPKLTARPVYLLLIVVTLLFARIFNLEPALVFGTVVAMDYGLQLGRARSAIATAVGALYAAAIGAFGWVVYTVCATLTLGSIVRWDEIAGESAPQIEQLLAYANVAIGELGSTLCIAALSTLPIALLPLSFLEGANLWRFNKLVWVVVYALGLTIYSWVLIPFPKSWATVGTTFAAWLGVYLTYVAIAVLFWVLLRSTRPKPEAGQPVRPNQGGYLAR